MEVRYTTELKECITDQLTKIGYTNKSVINLTLNNEYSVYAISLHLGTISYLIVEDESALPIWFPAVLFEVTDHQLPDSWFYNSLPNDQGYDLRAVWGYKELALEVSHYDALSECDPEALEIFNRYKSQLELSH